MLNWLLSFIDPSISHRRAWAYYIGFQVILTLVLLGAGYLLLALTRSPL